MRPVRLSFLPCFFFCLLSWTSAQSPCIYTTTSTSAIFSTHTTFVGSTTVTSDDFLMYKWITSNVFITKRTTYTSYIESTPTYILDRGTRTLGGYKFLTKSCPAGPNYDLACPRFTSTEDWTYTDYVVVGTTTVSSTWKSIVWIPRSTKVTTTTIATGSPPTTRTVTTTLGQTTISYTTTRTKLVTVGTLTESIQGAEVVLTTTHTTSLSSPTATATLKLFSLQITNTSNHIDGYTWGQTGPVTGSDVVIQNKSVWRYYIDPASQFLVHAPSGNYLAYNICDGEECDYPFTFVPDAAQPANDGTRVPRALKCEVGCGDLLQCWEADDLDGRSYVTMIVFDTSLGSLLGITLGGGGLEVNLRAVGPTKGR